MIVEKNPDKFSGEPVLYGTGIRVKQIIAYVNAGYTLEEIAELFDGICVDDLKKLMRLLYSKL